MNKEERQALREKHSEQYGTCVFCKEINEDGAGVYPCDVIQMLDELEMWVKE